MIMNEKQGTKYPRSGGTGENTPFAKQSKEKERDKVNDNNLKMKKMSHYSISLPDSFFDWKVMSESFFLVFVCLYV